MGIMANEIEFKVKLTKEQIIEFFNKRIKRNRCKNGKILYDSFYIKNDYYYETPNKNDVIRIREEDKRVIGLIKLDADPFEYCKYSDTINILKFLTYKKKSTVDGNEINEEFETNIYSKNVFEKIMESLGVKQYFRKNKISVTIDNQIVDEFVDYGIRYNIDLVCVNDKYYYLGFASAKIDDIANYIPARLGVILLSLGSLFVGFNFKNALKIGIRDRKNHKSPNCAFPEGAVSGALGIQLGGTNVYFGKEVYKPTIGDKTREIEIEDIVRTNKIMYSSSIISMIIFTVIYYLVVTLYRKVIV